MGGDDFAPGEVDLVGDEEGGDGAVFEDVEELARVLEAGPGVGRVEDDVGGYGGAQPVPALLPNEQARHLC